MIGGSAVAAMTRRGPGWVHNVAQGARCEAVPPGGDLGELAERAARAIGLDYAGVDLMRGRDGAPVVIEVNGIPAWQGLQSVASSRHRGAAGAGLRAATARRGDARCVRHDRGPSNARSSTPACSTSPR